MAPMARQQWSQVSTTMTARLASMRRPSHVWHDDAVLEHRWSDFRRVFGAGLKPPAAPGEAELAPRLSLAEDASWSGGGQPIPLERLPELEVLTSRPADDRTQAELATIVLGLRYFGPCLDVDADDMAVLARAARWRSCATGEYAVEEHEIGSCLLLQLCGNAHLVLKQRPDAGPDAGQVRPTRKARGAVQLEHTPTAAVVTAVLPLMPGDSVGDLPHGLWRATGVVAGPAGPAAPATTACFLVVRWSDFFAASMVERDGAKLRRVRLMRRVLVLRDFGDDALALMASCMTDRRAKRGEVLVQQGDEARHFYVLFSGEVEVIRTMDAVAGRQGVRHGAAQPAAESLDGQAARSSRPTAAPPTLITGRLRGPAYFGERTCFAVGEAYATTVRATTSCDLSFISRADLSALISPALLELVREVAAQPSDDDQVLTEALVEEHWRGYKAALVQSILANRDVRRWGAAAASDPKRAVRALKPMHPRIQRQFHVESEVARAGGVWMDDGFRTPVPRDAVADVESWAARKAYARQLLHEGGGTPIDHVIRRQLRTLPGGEDWAGNAALRAHAAREAREADRARGRGGSMPSTLEPVGSSPVRLVPPAALHNHLQRQAAEWGAEPSARSLNRPASRALLSLRDSREAVSPARWVADVLPGLPPTPPPRPKSASGPVPLSAKPPRFVAAPSMRCSPNPRPVSRAQCHSASVLAVGRGQASTRRGLSV